MNITDLFGDQKMVTKIQTRLPDLFYLAELESSRAGKVGMEVGSAREKIIIALFIYKFGEANIETNFPITEAEIDVKVFDAPISIKTITRKKLGGVKLIWTVDAEQARLFSEKYVPSCDIVLAQVNWDDWGALFYLPVNTQRRVLQEIGRSNYFMLPKPGTNPRGVEISSDALIRLADSPESINIPIKWNRKKIDYDPYARWLELWEKD
jgi:hypothetical protein